MDVCKFASSTLHLNLPPISDKIWPAGWLIWLGANLALFASRWVHWLGTPAVLLLGVVLPGALLTLWLLRHVPAPTWGEGVVYATGLGFALFVLLVMGLTLLPGGLRADQVVVTFNLAVGILGGLVWYGRGTSIAPLQPRRNSMQVRWGWIGLGSVLLIGALLRLPGLGYSEFLYDEIRVMHRAAEIIQGYEPALLLHRKGPTEIIIPTGIYAVTQRINEFDARLPFALANLVGLLGLYLIGRRLFGEIAGWSAAMLLALDGLFVGFSRFTQYQSIVFLMSVLVVLALHRQAVAARPLPGYLWTAGLAFVVGSFAHYEQVWVVIPGLYLLGVYVRRTGDWRGLLHAGAGPLIVSVLLLLAFFVPFLLDARWASTANNIFGKRIGGDFPYNNLRDFFNRVTIYTSAYQVLFMVIGAFVVYLTAVWRAWPRALALSAGLLGITGGLITFLVRPDWLRVGGTDHTWFFFALLCVGAILAVGSPDPDQRRQSFTAGDAARTVWLWFAVPMLVALFFVAEPNTHVYGFYMGWALVVGMAVEQGWAWLRAHGSIAVAQTVGIGLASVLIWVFGFYTFRLFTDTRVETLRTWRENRPWGYWTPYAVPERDSLYGFPYKNGWKVIGALYADGTLDAPYDANETGLLGDWYTRAPYFCPPDAEYYLLPTKLQPNEAGEYGKQLAELGVLGYREWGYVTVNDDPRLRIFTTRPVDDAPRIFDEAAYGPTFDATLTSPFFVKTGPALLTAPDVAVDYRFGELFTLKGYSLSAPTVARGETLRLDLYWTTKQMVELEDKTFVQIINLETLHKAAQRDAEPGCNKYALDDWRPGDLNFDPYTLTIAPDAPPGTYTILVGMYQAEGGENYPIFDERGAFLGEALPLTTVEVR
jgi:4-amino-4-deoxy-L-arabinose transferase-like glycosyltransferase